jgi:hypothetical protein
VEGLLPCVPRAVNALACSPGPARPRIASRQVPADFVGSALGESEKRTAAILEEARGCVLVIDEAYGGREGSALEP